MAAGVAEKFFWLSKTFSEWFLRVSTLHKFRSNLKGNKKKTVFIVFLGLKDFGGFKDRQEMSRFRVLPRSQVL